MEKLIGTINSSDSKQCSGKCDGIVMKKQKRISKSKAYRILALNDRLENGKVVSKYTAAVEYGVNERSIVRDIKELRNYYDNAVPPVEIVFDRARKGYVMRVI